MIYATDNGHNEVVELLLIKYGANPNITDNVSHYDSISVGILFECTNYPYNPCVCVYNEGYMYISCCVDNEY